MTPAIGLSGEGGIGFVGGPPAPGPPTAFRALTLRRTHAMDRIRLATAALSLAAAAPAAAQSTLWTTVGAAGGDRFALNIYVGGDFNGDGAPDLLVGSPDDNAAGSNAGAMIALSGVDGSILWQVNGSSPGANLGFQVAGVGDLDGDGVGDAVGGARYADTFGPNFGEAVVVSGATGTILYRVGGATSNGRFGEAVGSAGDANGDGFGDFIIGARLDSTQGSPTGAARVYSGVDGSLLHEILGSNGSDFLGRAVGTAGDLDGDGHDDFIVGSPGDDDGGSSSGSVRAFSGATGLQLWRVEGDAPSDLLGGKVSPAGDVDRDGTPDVIAGMIGSDIAGANVGAARVYSGVDGSTIRTLTGTSLGGEFGAAVWGDGDLNGDGYPDLLVGSRLELIAGEQRGSATAFSGFDGSVLFYLEGPSDLSQFGDTCVILGDVNGDGFDDAAIGAFSALGPGTAQVVSGRDTIGTTICGPAVPNTTGASARIIAEGSTRAADNALTLTVTQLPVGVNGIFATSLDQFTVASPGGSVGNLCIASLVIGRYRGNVLTSGPDGTVSMGIDLNDIPLPVSSTVVTAGETRYWQFWFRDAPSSNFSNAVAITFD